MDWLGHDQVDDLEDEGEGVVVAVVEEDELPDARPELEVVGHCEDEVDDDGEGEDDEVGAAETAEGTLFEGVVAEGEKQTDALDREAGDACHHEEMGKVIFEEEGAVVGGGVPGDVEEAVGAVDAG